MLQSKITMDQIGVRHSPPMSAGAKMDHRASRERRFVAV
jgi:hypothetical protein